MRSNQPTTALRRSSRLEAKRNPGLLRLPPELRLMIYEHVMPNFGDAALFGKWAILAILHVNRLLRAEALTAVRVDLKATRMKVQARYDEAAERIRELRVPQLGPAGFPRWRCSRAGMSARYTMAGAEHRLKRLKALADLLGLQL